MLIKMTNNFYIDFNDVICMHLSDDTSIPGRKWLRIFFRTQPHLEICDNHDIETTLRYYDTYLIAKFDLKKD